MFRDFSEDVVDCAYSTNESNSLRGDVCIVSKSLRFWSKVDTANENPSLWQYVHAAKDSPGLCSTVHPTDVHNLWSHVHRANANRSL
ncbi:hypothetical protein Celaphus_00009787 [Cervus elaphus hippelaphus]|uniref:Uncharacterized protein n=1 Tax=Cervus elaphus hippelaphus TaxID=46360 RepID=A0A212C0P4_CEREH|nr:hypothetical protein Celaphus_00009787 [Cervus elaphus hippelaphus]